MKLDALGRHWINECFGVKLTCKLFAENFVGEAKTNLNVHLELRFKIPANQKRTIHLPIE
jgi:hypothetical protein